MTDKGGIYNIGMPSIQIQQRLGKEIRLEICLAACSAQQGIYLQVGYHVVRCELTYHGCQGVSPTDADFHAAVQMAIQVFGPFSCQPGGDGIRVRRIHIHQLDIFEFILLPNRIFQLKKIFKVLCIYDFYSHHAFFFCFHHQPVEGNAGYA